MDGLIELSLRYTPYIVILGMIVLFLLCCYFLFRDGKSKQKPRKRNNREHDEYYDQIRRNFQNPYTQREEGDLEEESVQGEADAVWAESDPSDHTLPLATADVTDWNESQGVVSKELVRAVSEQPLEEADDATRIMPKITEDLVQEEPEIEPANEEAVPYMSIVDTAVAQYAAAFGILNPNSEEDARYITEYVFAQAAIDSEEVLMGMLEYISVQEALLQVQKAYVTTPTEWMRDVLTDAFCDVLKQPQSSTLYLVALDALKSLVSLQKGHLQALAIALIVQYSKNSNNYSLDNFRHYVTKYIEPLISDLPTQDDMYQQLEYLRCTSTSGEVRFDQILRSSYPLVFEYRGFTYEELEYVMQNTPVRTSITVPSFNSPLLKLCAIDEQMLPGLYQRAGITDQGIQQELTKLACSKAFDWENISFDEVLEYISPVLLDFCKTYNRLPLCRLNLTLLGLYLGRSMVKATIHEDFDISPWFS